jgi:hypothetical protein
MAAIKLTLFILICPLCYVVLFGDRRIIRRRTT